jgi:hypothetical protein
MTVTAAMLLVPLLAMAQVDTCWSHQVYNTTTTGTMSLATDIWADGAGNVYACGASDHAGNDNEDMAVVRYNEWGDTLWVRFIDGYAFDDGDIARALAVDSAGNVYIAGQLDNDWSDLDMTVAKFDSGGTLLWTWSSYLEDPDGLYDIIITPEGGVYACGAMMDPDSLCGAFAVVRLNPANGDLMWLNYYSLDYNADGARRLGDRQGAIDMYWDFFDEWNDWENCATALAYSPSDGSIVATGFGLHSTEAYQAWTMKFRPDGSLDWQRTDGRTALFFDDAAFDVVVANSGLIYVAGLDEDEVEGYNFSVVYMTAAGGDGARASFDGGIQWDEWACALCLDDSSSQSVYATGFLQVGADTVSPRRQAFTMKFGPDLSQRWGRSEGTYGSSYNEIGYDIAHCSGFVYVGCETDNASPAGPSDGMVLCYNTTNADPLVWAVDRVDFAPTPSCEYITGIAVTGPDHIYLATQTYPNWYGDRSKSQMWNCRLFVPDRDVRMEAIIAPAGRVTYLDTITPQVVVINDGNYRMDVSCRLWIEPAFRDTVVRARLLPAETAHVSFRDWVADPVGTLVVRCTLSARGDNDPYNNSMSRMVEVVSHDVGCFRVTVPTGMHDSGAVVVPAAWFRNYGAAAETFDARMTIGTAYNSTISVTLNPLDSVLRTFPALTLRERGMLAVRCSTLLATDIGDTNDLAIESVFVRVIDAAATTIVAPTGTVDSGSPHVPRASITNRGNTLVTLDARFDIRQSFDGDGAVPTGAPGYPGGAADLADYTSTVTVSNLGAGETREVSFDLWIAEGRGVWATQCSTQLSDDVAPANDRVTGTVRIRVAGPQWPYGWVEVAPMPPGNSGRTVKRGGALGGHEGDPPMVYGTKGYKTFEFFRYDMLLNQWFELAPVPPGGTGKAPDKGACLESDGAGHVYLVRGNNTSEFWRYTIASDSWYQMADVPLGWSGKRVKGGTDISRVVRDDTTWLYLLKGYKNEFFRYNTLTNEWVQCPDAPVGVKYKWDRGSWIVDDDELTIYAHKAKYYNRAIGEHELWKYDCRGDTWYSQRLHGMPLAGLHGGRIRTKKAKDGGAGDWYEDGIYALKGGNTQQFFRYAADRDTWQESDTMPTYGSAGRRKRVKDGADIVCMLNAFWALKGNRTREMWRYGPDSGSVATTPAPVKSGVAGASGPVLGVGDFDVRPNPLSGGGALHYAVPFATTVEARLYDATGRAVRTLLSARSVAGRGALRLDTGGLARGVYLLRLDIGDEVARTFKVVIE